MKLFILVASLLFMAEGFAGQERADGEKPIVVVIASYNNSEWYENNLSSILTQDYKNYRIIYVDDCSHDGTGAVVQNYLEERNIDHQVVHFLSAPDEDVSVSTESFKQMVNREPCFFTLVRNDYRHGALANLYRSVCSCSNDEIIATVDGDDWLYHNGVLKELNEVYSDNNIWLTHGRLIEYPSGHAVWCKKVPLNIVERNAYRSFRCPSHLRTFYAWLFKKIKLEDLLYNGRFFWMTWDMAMMYPMIEMAAERHKFIEDINYVYNMANQINDNKVDPDLQNELDRYIRSMTPYQRLNNSEVQHAEN